MHAPARADPAVTFATMYVCVLYRYGIVRACWQACARGRFCVPCGLPPCEPTPARPCPRQTSMWLRVHHSEQTGPAHCPHACVKPLIHAWICIWGVAGCWLAAAAGPVCSCCRPDAVERRATSSPATAPPAGGGAHARTRTWRIRDSTHQPLPMQVRLASMAYGRPARHALERGIWFCGPGGPKPAPQKGFQDVSRPGFDPGTSGL